MRLPFATYVGLLLIVGCAAPARAQTTALYFESQAGDWVGGGQIRTYLAAEATFAASTTTNAVTATVIAPGYAFWWYLNFYAPTGATIGEGTYVDAARFPTATRPGLDVFGDGRGCNAVTGRFVVRELVLKADGTVARLAVDFEQHCEDSDPALFGAIRYHSTVSALRPFEGAYPDYRLTITPPAHGSITGDGIACSPTESECIALLDAPGTISLTATPAPGYMFLGWRGSCRGTATIAVRINQPKECEALFDSTTTPTARTGLFLDSQSGDFIGQGRQWLYSGSTSTWTIDWLDTTRRGIRVNISDLTYWSLAFDPGPGGMSFPGTYFGATRSAFLGTAGMDIGGDGRGCNGLSGWFIVREFVTAPDGSIGRFAADFEQHCEDGDPALYGTIRYNSTVSSLTPFDGNYPDYRLTITPPAHGSVTGDGIACSPTQSVCVRSFAAPSTISLTAVPAAGYMFLGWRGNCRGVAAIAVRVNQPTPCEALFDSTTAPSARTGLFLDSQVGDSIGQGRQWLYNGSTGVWTVDWIDTSRRVIGVRVFDIQYWTLAFDPGLGNMLAPGTYFGATRYPFNSSTAGMDISGNGSGCNQLSGWFVVRELETATDGSIVRFAADFEQHCENLDAALYGAIRYNSAVSSLTPFDGSYPDYRLTIVPNDHGVVTGGTLDCGGTKNMCVVLTGGPTTIALNATPAPGYMFTGWIGDCAGGQNTSIRVNGRKQCAATFALTPPTITMNPASQTILEGQRAHVTAAAGSTSPLTVQWQVSTNGGSSFTNIAGAADNAYAFTALVTDTGKQFRAAFTNSGGTVTTTAATLSVSRLSTTMPTDLDGDARDDLVVWRPGAGTWYWTTSSSGMNDTTGGRQWGSRAAGDVPMMGEMDGDGKADLVVWRGGTGTWYWLTSSSGYSYETAGSKQWGNQSSGDIPMLGDVDGDGKADLIVWRATTGTFFWLTSSSGYSYADYGQRLWGSQSSGDNPILADFDGDGLVDLGVWRASTGTWFWLTSSSGYSEAMARQQVWGTLGDLPLTGDVDGDGKADLIVWRGSTGTWFWLTSSSGYSYDAWGHHHWGNQAAGDVPLMPDLDGDGKADLAVWRASTGTWYWLSSGTGYEDGLAKSKAWGSAGDPDIPMGK